MWLIGLALLGVLFAFPLKRRFINEEQLPFPEGRAAGVVMETLHSESGSRSSVLPAKLLVIFTLLAGLGKFLQWEAWQAWMAKIGLDRVLALPEFLDEWYYRLAEKYHWPAPNILPHVVS